jgi:hypothetical protein
MPAARKLESNPSYTTEESVTMSTDPVTETHDHRPAEILAIIESVAETVQAYYVFPDTAHQVAQQIRSRRDAGEYSHEISLQSLCDRLTMDLQAATQSVAIGHMNMSR